MKSLLSNPLRAQRASWLAIGLAMSLSTLGAGTARAATGVLENPAQGSAQSGIGVISGWVCDAETVTVTIDGSIVLEAAYGTGRADTRPICGDNNNGFGLLWNFNLFGAGFHTIVAEADGEEIGAATFTVTKLGNNNFETDFSGSFGQVQFPTAGSSFSLLWQESSQNFVITPFGTQPGASVATAAAAPSVEQPAATLAALENPGQFASGVWLFSGWVCDAERVVVVIDGTRILRTAYGTPRGDTQAACGDIDNGFGLLWNFNLFDEGEHTVEVRADGVTVVPPRTFTVTDFGQNFVTGASASYRLTGFPTAGEDTFVRWEQARQNFAIFAKSATGAPTPTPGPTPSPTPKPSNTPGGVTPTPGGNTPTPNPTNTPGGNTPTPGAGQCGNGVADPGEECDGNDLRGFTCETAYLSSDDPTEQECFGDPLACDPDCTFNSENTEACQCSCEEDFDCAFPDDPEGVNRPLGIDCTTIWCPKAGCPCDHLADEETYAACIDANFDVCEFFDDCLLDVGCFIGDVGSFYFFSTGAGICGENQNGTCDTDAASFKSTEQIRREICTSSDPLDPEFFRCESYCDSCDCTNPNQLGTYNPDEGECS
jgi:hypothetical protein